GLSTGTGLAVNGSGSVTSTGGINGPGGIAVSTTGTVTGSGGNGFDGAVTFSNGIYRATSSSGFCPTVGNTTGSGPGTINVNNPATDYGTEAISISGNGFSGTNGSIHTGGAVVSTFDGPITVAGSTILNMDNGSTLQLANANSLTGAGPNFVVTVVGGG